MNAFNPDAVNKLIADSADLCRLSLVIGKSAESAFATQKEAFIGIGFDEAAADGIASLIVSRALEGFTFSEENRAQVVFTIRAATDAIAF